MVTVLWDYEIKFPKLYVKASLPSMGKLITTMLTFLVPLRPDETLFSFIARQKYYTHSNTSSTYRDLFGVSQLSLNKFLPNVKHLNTTVLSNYGLSKIDFENNLSLYPLYRASIIERRNLSRPHLIFGGKREIKNQELKYCSECIQEDRSIFGEAYWHRVHNIPNIILCVKHNSLLNTWQVPIDQVSNRNLFCLEEVLISINESVKNENSDLLEFTKRVEQALLTHKSPSRELVIERALVSGLLVKGTKKNALQSVKFSKILTKFFRDINIHPGRDFRRIRAALSSANKFCDPITLIAIELLCEKILATPKDELVCPKFSCNNKICAHYETITKITSQFYELNHRKTEGSIQKCCSCGHSVIINLKRGKLLYVVDYGHLLLDKVIQLVNDGQSYSSISRQLQIGDKAVSKLFNTKSSTVIDLKASVNRDLVEQRRKFWKDYLKGNDVKNLSKLKGFAKTVYRFLQINDSAWLISFNKKSGLKKIKACGRTPSSFSDHIILSLLIQGKKDLLESNIERRVSKHLLLKHIAVQGLTHSKISELKLTSKFLRTECETFLAWKKRRIQNFVQLKKNIGMTIPQILDKFKADRNTKSEQQELKAFVKQLLKA